MAVKEIGLAGTRDAGWRTKAADAVAPRVGRSSLPLREEQARAALGLLFLALSVKYVVSTLQKLRRG
jgi:hypothetical protein